MSLVCKICFESALVSNRARVTVCGHVFCHDCSKRWFSVQNMCPVCRREINEANNELISLYDQGSGDQRRSLTPIDASSIVNWHPAASSPSSSKGTDGVSGFDPEEDVQVKLVLGLVSDRWQHLMIERAQLKADVARLEARNQYLERELMAMQAERREYSSPWTLDIHSPSKPYSWDGNLQNKPGGPPWAPVTQEKQPRVEWHPNGLRERWAHLSQRRSNSALIPMEVQERIAARQWELDCSLPNHSEPVHGVSVDGSSTRVATASWDHTCRIWDMGEMRETACLSGHKQGLYAVQWCKSMPDIVGTVSSDQTCRLWNATTGECVEVLEAHTEEVNGLSFQRDSRLLATASDDKTAIVWDIDKAYPITQLQGHQSIVYGVCFQPNGHLIATASFDWTSKLWDPRNGEDILTLSGHNEDIIGIDIDESGYFVATGSDDQTCRIWDLRMGLTLQVLREHSGEVKRVVFSPFGSLLATTSGDSTVRIFNMLTLECEQVLSSHRDHVFDADWSPTMDFLVTAGHDKLWKVWRPKLDEL